MGVGIDVVLGIVITIIALVPVALVLLPMIMFLLMVVVIIVVVVVLDLLVGVPVIMTFPPPMITLFLVVDAVIVMDWFAWGTFRVGGDFGRTVLPVAVRQCDHREQRCRHWPQKC